MGRKGLFIDYEYCTGCHACEVAGKMEKNLPTEQFCIKVSEIGPWEITPGDNHWQYTYIPVPTDQCDLCVDRTNRGELPTCVKHCQAAIMKYGEVADFAQDMESKKKVVCFTVE